MSSRFLASCWCRPKSGGTVIFGFHCTYGTVPPKCRSLLRIVGSQTVFVSNFGLGFCKCDVRSNRTLEISNQPWCSVDRSPQKDSLVYEESKKTVDFEADGRYDEVKAILFIWITIRKRILKIFSIFALFSNLILYLSYIFIFRYHKFSIYDALALVSKEGKYIDILPPLSEIKSLPSKREKARSH